MVSGCLALLFSKSVGDACSWLLRKWDSSVPLCFKPADNSHPWFYRKWVAVMPYCILRCWWCLSLVLQLVSGCCAMLPFKLANDAFPRLFSLWVATVPSSNWSWLMKLVHGSLVCEWLLCLAVFQASWQCISLVFQDVSDSCALLHFKMADNAYPWLFRKWVALMFSCVSSFLTMPLLCSLDSEWLPFLGAFLPANNDSPWIFS